MCFTFFFLSLSPSGKSPPSSLNATSNSPSSSFLYAVPNLYYFVAAAAVAAAAGPAEEDLPPGRMMKTYVRQKNDVHEEASSNVVKRHWRHHLAITLRQR